MRGGGAQKREMYAYRKKQRAKERKREEKEVRFIEINITREIKKKKEYIKIYLMSYKEGQGVFLFFSHMQPRNLVIYGHFDTPPLPHHSLSLLRSCPGALSYQPWDIFPFMAFYFEFSASIFPPLSLSTSNYRTEGRVPKGTAS